MGYAQGQWTPTKRRGPIAAEFTGPGPAALSLPSLFGSSTKDGTKPNAPSFSLNGRPKTKLDSLGPGPATYDLTSLTNSGKAQPTGTIISGRLKEPAGFVTPSPAHYNPEKSDGSVHEISPKFTFGHKGKDAKLDDIPAPNKYTIPGLVGSNVREGSKKGAPAFSMSQRNKLPPPPKTPGPGAYKIIDEDMVKAKSPKYTFSPRYEIPSDKTKVPGPGAFSPEKVKLDESPAVSFGIRHSPYVSYLTEKKGRQI